MAVPYAKILVPLDGSELAGQALSHAALLAKSFGAELVLLRAVDDLARQQPEMMAAELPEQGTELIRQHLDSATQDAVSGLQHLADDLAAQSVVAKTKVVTGNASDVILDAAADDQVDLIVMSTHGRTGLTRWLFGSVAEKVHRRATCPVLLVRAGSGRKAEP